MTNVKELVTAAKAGVENLTPAEVAAEVDDGDVLLVDVREPGETANGIIPTAVLAPRGMLEFFADATSPNHLAAFDPCRRLIVYSAAGSRSALATASLQHLGYRDVAHLDGGYQRWLDDGWPVFPADPRAQVELVLPDDSRQFMLRVRMNDKWVGDLLFCSLAERDTMLGALTAGAVSVVRRPVPVSDFSFVDAASGSRNQRREE